MVSRANKNQHIRTKNMHASQSIVVSNQWPVRMIERDIIYCIAIPK